MRTTEPTSLEEKPAQPSEDSAVVGWSSKWSAKQRVASLGIGVAATVIGVLGLLPVYEGNLSTWLLAAFMGVLGVHGIRRAIDPRPRIEVTSDGITDRTALGGGDLLIRWEEIREVRLTPLGGKLELIVEDLAAVRKRAGWPRRLWMMLGAAKGKKAITITSDPLGPNMAIVRRQVERGLLAHERAELGLPPSPDRDVGRIEGE